VQGWREIEPLQVLGVPVVSRTSAATSSRRAQSVVGAFLAQRWATVVPHDPPPITATCIGIGPDTRSPLAVRLALVGSNAAAVLVPVKAFGQAKQRLADVLEAPRPARSGDGDGGDRGAGGR
jgi:hypothetical protein